MPVIQSVNRNSDPAACMGYVNACGKLRGTGQAGDKWCCPEPETDAQGPNGRAEQRPGSLLNIIFMLFFILSHSELFKNRNRVIFADEAAQIRRDWEGFVKSLFLCVLFDGRQGSRLVLVLHLWLSLSRDS